MGWRVRLRASLAWFQRELLDAPVQDLGDVQLILRGAGHFVDPAELLGLAAGFAEPSEHFPVQRQLVNAAGEGIRAIEILYSGSGSYADGPRRACGGNF